MPGLLRDLESSGVGLESIEVHRPTLDDVFLTLTGRSLRDAETELLFQEMSTPLIKAAGLSPRRVEGGAELDGAPGLHQDANLRLRTVSRVWLRLGRFPASDAAALTRGLAGLPLEPVWDRTAEVLAELARPGDVVLTLGAGDVTRVGPQLLALLEERSEGER